MSSRVDLPQGTLDLLFLKALAVVVLFSSAIDKRWELTSVASRTDTPIVRRWEIPKSPISCPVPLTC